MLRNFGPWDSPHQTPLGAHPGAGSARIMTIADVFDALVSRRSYKKPFTFEQAMKMIEEGAGTHFDPVIAKVFVEAWDDVKKIADDFYEA